MLTILVVEDDPSLNTSIRKMLTKEGYRVYGANTAGEAVTLFLRHAPYIVLLDIMLPDMNGYDLIFCFKQHHECRILMLTALDDKQNKQIAYTAGADDYITKPFDMFELIYKLRAVSRQIVSHMQLLYIGDIICDVEKNTLSCRDSIACLQPSQTRFLKSLYIAYQERKCCLQLKQAPSADESDHIYMIVSRLRKHIKDIKSNSVMIESVYGKGYSLTVIGEQQK